MYSPELVVILAISSSIAAVMGSYNICPAQPAVSCSCPSQWQMWHYVCYRITPSPHSWDDAKTKCQDLGGKMAAPRSLEEMKFMVDLARKLDSNYHVWIACTDKEAEGTWECDGQEGREPFLEWSAKQPDDFQDNQDCAYIFGYFNDKMDDGSCSVNHKAVCAHQAACPHHSTQPRRYCLSTDTHGRILNSTCLLDHSIREFITEGVVACGSACAKEPGCRSFNIKKSEKGKKICQLKNSTSSEDKDKFQNTDYFCMYSEVCIG
ncbi:perlucin-like protein [Patiria miniata]|uniref:C-type lectin domain-containing protein n=1 Tax=Patiria miniata TaxID=46514 RepID=A0A913Z0A5_PATMI|nr:perlucin-like protein [Patiria miniata]